MANKQEGQPEHVPGQAAAHACSPYAGGMSQSQSPVRLRGATQSCACQQQTAAMASWQAPLSLPLPPLAPPQKQAARCLAAGRSPAASIAAALPAPVLLLPSCSSYRRRSRRGTAAAAGSAARRGAQRRAWRVRRASRRQLTQFECKRRSRQRQATPSAPQALKQTARPARRHRRRFYAKVVSVRRRARRCRGRGEASPRGDGPRRARFERRGAMRVSSRLPRCSSCRAAHAALADSERSLRSSALARCGSAPTPLQTVAHVPTEGGVSLGRIRSVKALRLQGLSCRLLWTCRVECLSGRTKGRSKELQLVSGHMHKAQPF
eukprot:359983-Chlamydomonas_euryale.AAC.6